MIAEEICHRLICSLCPHMKYSLILLCNGLCSICVSNCTVYSGLCLVLFCLVRYQRWSSWIMVQVCVLASVSCPVLTSQTCAFCAFLYFSFPKVYDVSFVTEVRCRQEPPFSGIVFYVGCGCSTFPPDLFLSSFLDLK